MTGRARAMKGMLVGNGFSTILGERFGLSRARTVDLGETSPVLFFTVKYEGSKTIEGTIPSS